MDNYGINDIKSLDFRTGVRTRIQMYLGSDDNEGTYQALKEIINNSTDEAIAGYGKKIEISIDEKLNKISIRDYGRGVPFGIREDGENVLISIYSKSHTGGKFDNNVYKNASGLNGIGGKCVCLSSSFFKVESYREGKSAIAIFEKGFLKSYKEINTTQPNGTFIEFIPDEEVFKNGQIGYSYDKICQDIRDISYLYSGIEFIIKNVNTNQKNVFCAKNGIIDFVKDNVKSPLNEHIITYEASDGEDKLEIAFQWGSNKEQSYVFVNGLRCPEGGSPITGAKSAITRTFNSLSKSEFDGDSIRSNLFYVINCSVCQPSFANQTKSKINNANLRTLASNAFSDALKAMSIKYKSEFDKIVEMLKKVARAEAAAERARKQVLEATKEQEQNQKKKILNVDKLRDARKLGKDSTLLLCEGLSAGGSMSIGRDPNKYGILMLRGKCKNLLNCSIEEGLQNEEVKLFQQALGIIYGKSNNIEKMRYGKIAIASDSDFDGSHIGLLILAMSQVLCPELIQNNHLYWLRAPIYKVSTKTKNYYYYTEEEFNNHPNGTIVKYKGLGQMSDQDLKESMFSEEWQRLEPIEFSKEGLDSLIKLMGENVDYRKEFVFNNIDFSKFVIE